jgi:hypothetical protein
MGYIISLIAIICIISIWINPYRGDSGMSDLS